MQQSQISLHPSLDSLEELKLFIRQACQAWKIPKDDCLTLELVSEEWFINIVVHGYRMQEDAAPVDVVLSLTPSKQLSIQFTDAAPPFNPLEAEVPDTSLPFEERPIGGLGIHIIRSKMDKLEYRRTGKYNQLTMRKHIK